jgi:AAA15 family ATPase/GTPase
MLIQFTVGNFRTFKEKATLSLVASNYDKETRVDENIILNKKFKLRILKSAVIYGANASGKSKFIEAMSFMQWMALNSFRKIQVGEKIDVHPFALDANYENAPSYFEIIFLQDNALYRYGFEVNKEAFVAEWLYVRETRKEILIFERKGQEHTFHPTYFKIGKSLLTQELFRDNALLLSSAAQSNNSRIASIISWFKKLQIISELREEGFEGYTIKMLSDSIQKHKILNLLKAADLSIVDITARPPTINKYIARLPQEPHETINEALEEYNAGMLPQIRAFHKKFDENGISMGLIDLSMEEDESSGTQKFFKLAGPLFDALENANILVVDELDSKLHPNLVCKILDLFNSKASNPNNAQLVFNTQSTNLLDSGIFRRDQVWFTEKDRYGAATMFSLADINVRKTENYGKNYVEGRYGAVPYLGDFDDLHLFRHRVLSE